VDDVIVHGIASGGDRTLRVAWGAGLTASKMKDCRWLKPVLVAQIEFLEWTGDNHLRHTKFIALRDDKPARHVRRE
jgi:bifunctional non-homologous end joining protein LigD